MSRGEDELYGYYQRELDYLRNAGREFARQHPETARRLELGELESADPHVERLIESFAFLTGRVRRELDNEAPDMAAALLEALLPNSMAPLPPMTIVQMAADPAKGKDSAGRHVAAHTPLVASAIPTQRAAGAAEVECQFRTCFPLTLWPMSVASAGFEEASAHPGLEREPEVAGVLRLSLVCNNGMAFGSGEDCIAPERLRFHLHDSWHNAGALYDWLLCHVKRILVVPGGRRAAHRLGEAASWDEAGFGAEDAVLPEAGQAHPAYRQLQEYFAYPRKYLFFDAGRLGQTLRGFSAGPRREQQADLLLLVTHRPPSGISLHAGQFLLGCTPAINLFPRTTETLRLDQRQYEYRLVPDARQEASTEIHSLLKVEASYADGQGGMRLTPYYDFGRVLHGQTGTQWLARRVPGSGTRAGGTDVLLSFLDVDSEAGFTRMPLVSASALCTNRRLAEEIRPDPPGQSTFRAPASAGVLPVRCLVQPTAQVMPPLDGRQLWRVLSLLNLNHVTLDQLSASREGSALAMVQRLLELANSAGSPGGTRQARSLVRFECRRAVRPVRGGPVPGFRRGHELVLEFAKGAYSDGTPLMLAAVLQRFFQMYCSVNSFACVTVMAGEERVKEWLPATSSR
ncbi:type VI secretion system baseplate subunit TssF [Pseudoduganella violaceinigra]|uniref:type VI secretion system baseplate subunit TssF n=1 Tax=Pseudoduganella violaceinigra TaxID=246602 RepID=UPI00041CB928|nr:type VI secretion system baseplate subunit TssF [Pseudoduganella violaceinigra]